MKTSNAQPDHTSVSIIIPVLNEEAEIGRLLDHLDRYASNCEVIVVDGGSTDATVRLVENRVILQRAGRGRGTQLNAGAAVARGDVLWFLHADTLPHPASLDALVEALSDPQIVGGGFEYGFVDANRRLRFFAWYSNRKNQLARRVYGDMGMFVRRDIFDRLGGFPSQQLMEDFEFGRRLARTGRIAILPHRIMTSARDWRHEGITRKILKDFLVRTAYRVNVSNERLYRWYYGGRHETA